jgi:hypothetical protein
MATTTIPAVPELAPYVSKTATTGNYVNFADSSFDTWAQQYLPELYEAEVERYGDRSVSSFLRLVGAELPMASDQVIWSEQGRLHIARTGLSCTDAGVVTCSDTAIRAGSTVLVTGGGLTGSHVCYVDEGSETSTTQFKIYPYKVAAMSDLTGFDDGVTIDVFVFGSEFGKGASGMQAGVNPEVDTFNNRPIIQKDVFKVSGSDAAQIGWIEVSGEAGQNGYLWYLKAEGDTRVRFEDYLEMAMVEAIKGVPGSSVVDTKLGSATATFGTQGLFDAIKERGLEADQVFSSSEDVIPNFDVILKELDKQGAIEENMMFLNRTASIAMDDALATQNANHEGGTSWGVFENSEQMAINLGFVGFRRGSYDFYKSDWKYLNNKSTRGGANFGDVQGVLIPAGTSSVYDQMLGKNIRRPFLHIRYRASETEDRRLKSWVVGSVGGAANSDVDDMNVHYLSERCLVTQAANNFCLFTDANYN